MPRLLKLPMHPGRALALSTVILSALLAGPGCQFAPSVSAKVTTADGETIEVPLESGNTPVTDGIVTVRNFQFAPWDMGPDKPKALTFTFVVGFKEGYEPSSVLVEDFTEQPILQVFSDPKAHPSRNHFWAAVTTPYAPQDPHMNWMLDLDNSIRLYRFTVKLKDGTTHVLLKPMFVPAQMKMFMRTQLGINN
jgi:hypothetical protein